MVFNDCTELLTKVFVVIATLVNQECLKIVKRKKRIILATLRAPIELIATASGFGSPGIPIKHCLHILIGGFLARFDFYIRN